MAPLAAEMDSHYCPTWLGDNKRELSRRPARLQRKEERPLKLLIVVRRGRLGQSCAAAAATAAARSVNGIGTRLRSALRAACAVSAALY